MILVTFAVPQESRAFTARLRHAAPLGPAQVGNLGIEEVGVLHTGMGAEVAHGSVANALDALHPARVIASGFAGGLDPALAPGTPIAAVNLSTAPQPAGIRAVQLTSAPAPLDTPVEKSRLRASTGADAVDLESAAIAAACAAARTPLLVLRIISDAADEPLPLPSPIAYAATRQRIRPLAILRHLYRHPEALAPLVRFTRRLPMLQRTLADALVAAILVSEVPAPPRLPLR